MMGMGQELNNSLQYRRLSSQTCGNSRYSKLPVLYLGVEVRRPSYRKDERKEHPKSVLFGIRLVNGHLIGPHNET